MAAVGKKFTIFPIHAILPSVQDDLAFLPMGGFVDIPIKTVMSTPPNVCYFFLACGAMDLRHEHEHKKFWPGASVYQRQFVMNSIKLKNLENLVLTIFVETSKISTLIGRIMNVSLSSEGRLSSYVIDKCNGSLPSLGRDEQKSCHKKT